MSVIYRGCMQAQQHQLEVTLHLAARCKHQKGMLIYHKMGTGKTLTALIFAMTFPNRRVIVVAPEEILFTWKHEVAKLGLLRPFEWHTYSQIQKLRGKMDGAVLIMDEAHNFVQEASFGDSLDLMEEMKGAFKILLLTGTPITSAWQGWSELIILINIAAGRELLPYNRQLFEAQYMVIDRKKAAVWGYTEPIIRWFNWVLVVYVKLAQDIIHAGTLLSAPAWFVNALQVAGLVRGPYVRNSAEQDLLSSTVWQRLGATTQRLLREIVSPVHIITDIPKRIVAHASSEIMKLVFGPIRFWYIQLRRREFRNIRKLDEKKLGRVIEPFVSFYDMGENPAYPTVKFHVRSVPYDYLQNAMFVKLQAGLIEIVDVKNLRNTTNAAEAGFYSNISANGGYRQFRDASRRISCLCYPNKGYFTPKFARVLETIDMAGPTRAVVYSEFQSTFDYFKLFLDFRKRPYRALEVKLTARKRLDVLEAFRTGSIQILMLHPKLTEGISILGATQLHVLEPLQHVHRLQQVSARVVRFLSHDHLQPSERHVDVYSWQATLGDHYAKQLHSQAIRGVELLRHWWKYHPEVVPPLPGLEEPLAMVSKSFRHGSQPQTIDEEITSDIEHISRAIDSFSRHLKLLKASNTPVDCCIWDPDEHALKSCLQAAPACELLYTSPEN